MDEKQPKVPLDDEAFEDVFFSELDSWVSADIACCDSCYENYLDIWPKAYSDDNAVFQTNQMPLDVFYDGSRVSSHYTKEQFLRLAGELECPNCGETLGYNLYPYNLPFDVPDSFEKNLREVGELGRTHPFLILTHEFAKTVYDAIDQAARRTDPNELSCSLFRARALAGLGSFAETEFDFVPREYASEGRYNHAGSSVMYLGDSIETCYHELREQNCAIAEIYLTVPLRIFDLSDPYESHTDQYDLLNSLIFSALLSAPQESKYQYKPEYVFSRFISDCARHVGFDAIKYPTTRKLGNGFNLALLNAGFALNKNSKVLSTSIFDGSRSRSIEI